MPEWIGKTIGNVRIEKFLTRGGMAEVYLGTHLALARLVAVKVLHSFIEEEPIPLERFEREAKVAATMRHPNIVQIHDFGRIDGHPYIVMEYLKGPTLASYLQHQRKKRIPHPQVARLLTGLADALDYAHERGIIHRDVKPANILLHNKTDEIPLDQTLPEDVEPVLTDFGLVRLVDTDTHTTSGMISGTPAYMSPEQARGDKMDHRTDIYSLGIVLYELLAGRVPFKADHAADNLAVVHMQIHATPQPIPELPAKIQAVLDRALQKNPKDRYQSNLELALDFSRSIGLSAEPGKIQEPAVSFLLAQISSTFQSKPFDGRCPYKGLDVFEEEDAELFFGREKSVEDLIKRVKESRTVFIIGPSGSGKSSLVRAGLLHTLRQGAMEDLNSERWMYETMTPGRDPIGELARVISSMAQTTHAGEEVRANAREDESIFTQWCEIALKEGRDRRAVLLVDQFEEVFTQVSHEEERLTFLNLLTHAASTESGRVIVLFAMRSDFVLNCATYPQLNALFNQQSIQIGAMEPNELVSAIAQPALRAGLRIDPDLVAQIVNDMQGEPGALPLMQFALKDLFDAQQALGGAINLTLANYLNHGGIHKSLERHADGSFAKLNHDEQELARAIFSGLIEIGHGTPDTRRTAIFDELIPPRASPSDVKRTIRKLADARLITTDEHAGKDTVTISHEKLIDAWPWLKKLVNENRETIAMQNEIAKDAKEWDKHGRDASYLYRGARLASAQEQLQARKLVLSGLAQDFIDVGTATYTNELEEAKMNADRLLQITKVALARQLAAQAQAIIANRNTRQMIAVLLAIQSMKLYPTSEAAQVLLNDNFAARTIACMTHDDRVWSVAFSPNGNYVASGGDDATAHVWDVATGKEVARMTHHPTDNSRRSGYRSGYVRSVAFSPDSKYIVSGGWDEFVRVWDVASGKEIARMTHLGSVHSVAFSPDGKYVVSGGDYTARVWEAVTGKEVVCMTHDDDVRTLAISPDGKYVVSGSSDKTARVWEAITGKEVARMYHEEAVERVAFSPDGEYVISSSWQGIERVWEGLTGKLVRTNSENVRWHFHDFSRDGRYEVIAEEFVARVIDAASGKEVARMTHDEFVTWAAFSLDGKVVASGSYDKTVRVWEVKPRREVIQVTHDGSAEFILFSSDGKYVLSQSRRFSVDRDQTARVWEAVTGKELARMTAREATFAFSPDGKYVAAGSLKGTAHVWEAATGDELARLEDGDVIEWSFPDGAEPSSEPVPGAQKVRLLTIAFSQDGKYVASRYDRTARVWEVTTGQEVAHMTHDYMVTSVAFSPDGKYVASASHQIILFWEAMTGKEVARMTHDNYVSTLAISPDGKYVVSSSRDKTVRVWEVLTGQEVAQMTHDDYVSTLAISPDGKYVVSGSHDKTARVWEAMTGREVARMRHDGGVSSVAFSPDGKYVVSGSHDKTARVWEAFTGSEIVRLIHDDGVAAVAFSPDGRTITSGGLKTVRIWMWQPEDLISMACEYLPRNLTRAEWMQYIGDVLPYEAVCPNLPILP
jgi:WD40 repeat protein/serine/threonine protein kinase